MKEDSREVEIHYVNICYDITRISMKSLIFTCVCMKRQKQIEYYAPQMNIIDLFSCNKREYLSFFLYLSLSLSLSLRRKESEGQISKTNKNELFIEVFDAHGYFIALYFTDNRLVQ